MAREIKTNLTTDVLIGGKVYRLAGAEPEYLHNVAALLNRKLAEIKTAPGYKNLDPAYKELMLNLNIADEYFQAVREADSYKKQLSDRDDELYTARHDLVSMKMKLENALKQDEILEKRLADLKEQHEALKKEMESRTEPDEPEGADYNINELRR